MLNINDLHIAFGSRKVLNGVSFELKPQTITTLMGANGAGKTTLFNIITGFLKAESGNILYNGKELNGDSPASRNKSGITRTFQDLRLIRELTVKENIILAFKGNPGENIFSAMLPQSILKKYSEEFDKRADNIIEQIFLNDVKDSLAGEISYGQQKLLTLGCCMANDADLMLLDEPVAGVNPDYCKKIQSLLAGLKDKGKTLLMIDHNSDFIESVSDDILFLNEGTLTKFDNYTEFKQNDFVKSAYL